MASPKCSRSRKTIQTIWSSTFRTFCLTPWRFSSRRLAVMASPRTMMVGSLFSVNRSNRDFFQIWILFSQGLMSFTNRLKEIALEDESVANLFEDFKSLLVPPLNLRTQCVWTLAQFLLNVELEVFLNLQASLYISLESANKLKLIQVRVSNWLVLFVMPKNNFLICAQIKLESILPRSETSNKSFLLITVWIFCVSVWVVKYLWIYRS